MSIIRKPFFCIIILRGTSVFDRRTCMLESGQTERFYYDAALSHPLIYPGMQLKNIKTIQCIAADFNRIPLVLHFAQFGCYIVHHEGSLPEIVQYDPSSCFECFTASKGFNN